MQTKDSPDRVTELPPAPAPTSRGANPWSISDGRRDGEPVRGRARAPQAGGTPVTRRDRFLQGAAGPLIVALVMGLFAFLRGRRGGGFEDYKSLLIALAVIAFLVMSRIGRRSSSRQRRNGGDTRD